MSPDPPSRPQGRPVTTRDVADAAGVNQSTVSRALRNSPSVSKHLRDKIIRIAGEMGYRPNPYISAFTAHVRSYRKSPHRATIALLHLMAYKTFDFSQNYRQGAVQRAEQLGYQTEDFHLHQVGGSFECMKKILWTRNITGVLLFPVSEYHAIPDEFFEGMAVSTVDPSVYHAHLYRAQTNYLQAMQLCLAELNARGYRRPAFCSLKSEVGTIGTEWLCGYAGWMAMRPPSERLEAFLLDGWDESQFKKWVRKAKPDAIISNDQFFFWWAEAAGFHPPKVAYASLGLIQDRPDISGVDQNGELVGAAAIDLIVAQIHRNEYGIPAFAKTVLIEPSWHEGTTSPSVEKPAHETTLQVAKTPP